jgi:tRNA pseudouridine38-40 synthase
VIFVKNYLLRIQYIGGSFFGFQKQKGILTVQGLIEETLQKILRKPISTYGSARTDRGVNALNQYLNFYFPEEISILRFREKLNSILFNSNIFVKEVREVDLKFHARKSAHGKIYAYIVSDKPQEALFMKPKVYFYNLPLNKQFLDIALSGLKGKHDFSIFSNRDKTQPNRNNICEIFQTGLVYREFLTIFYFYADRFLYHMVRRMIYYILKAGQGSIPVEILENPFSAEKVPYTRQVLPGEPLFLVDVIY